MCLDEAVLEDILSSTSESEAIDADEPVYDPSRWTPMEIATATGNSNNTVLEHSLKLRSTYTEVQVNLWLSPLIDTAYSIQ